MNCLFGPRQVWLQPSCDLAKWRRALSRGRPAQRLAFQVSLGSLGAKEERPGILDWFRTARAARTVRGLLQSSPQDAAVCSSGRSLSGDLLCVWRCRFDFDLTRQRNRGNRRGNLQHAVDELRVDLVCVHSLGQL